MNLKKVSEAKVFVKEYKQWHSLSKKIKNVHNNIPALVIIPCDPWSVGGSRGDEAMIMAVIQNFRTKYPKIPITVVSGSEKGDEYINDLPIENVSPMRIWTGNYPLERIYKGCINAKATHVVLLGADCMDGFYSPSISLTLLSLHDLFTRTPGIESFLMGFSFNENPYWLMPMAFRHISNRTVINLRDDVSRQRFISKTGIKAGLVADSAFMLIPDNAFEGYNKLEAWIHGRRFSSDRFVIGMNFHPMLRKYSGPEDIRKDALVLAHNVEQILKGNPSVDFVFIPHDDRSCLTDNLMLGVMHEYIVQIGLGDRIYYDEKVYRAPQIKAICHLLDGLVSSRMHFAIAALGQGKSVLVASYQGKFDGLFKHFNLPNQYILPPNSFISDEMVSVFNDYLSHITALNAVVRSRIDEVIELSERNIK
ncbi:MAG: polysaccharide pyruvyl transferase family protein [Bacteroidales bacterium]|nr:polysaccharide pyruvyl transferase family protein [Bacteroidales bacterium]